MRVQSIGDYDRLPVREALAQGEDDVESGPPEQDEAEPPMRPLGYVCPECGSNALVYEEGCQKCYACGYSAC
ncbi:MAG TPA: hypothetical protein VH599_21635 [Ktedonobacterales bacterium]|jgi:ribonucleoside-diphosphate reductase alpha chain